MGILDKFFGKKRKVEEVKEKFRETNVSLTPLKEVCGNEQDTYEALYEVMFLDPTKIKITLKEAASKAEELEKSNNMVRAALYYRIAGGLALHEGDVSKVKKYFSKCAELTGRKFKILEIPEKAVKKAQEYYKKYLQGES